MTEIFICPTLVTNEHFIFIMEGHLTRLHLQKVPFFRAFLCHKLRCNTSSSTLNRMIFQRLLGSFRKLLSPTQLRLAFPDERDQVDKHPSVWGDDTLGILMLVTQY